MRSRFQFETLRLAAALVLLFAAAFAMAQGIVTGSITGVVEDAQGAVLANAKVAAREVATNRVYTGSTSDSGVFTLRSLPAGTYEVRIEAPNFRKYANQGVEVTVGSEISLGKIRMEIGSASEVLTVEAAAPLVDSSTVQLSQSFDAKKAQDLPIGNTFDSLALFVPGVASAGDADFSNSNGAELSVNGQRARSNNFQIDGQGNNDNSIGGPSIFFGNQDAIAEVQVVTNFSAEYGRNMGAVLNVVTKSGSNLFHGTGYEFYQGSHFDSLTNEEKNPVLGICAPAENPSDGCTPVSVPRFVDNRFGGSIGGPILKDHAWFFASTNMERQRVGSNPSNSAGSLTPTPNGIQQLLAAFPNSPGAKVEAQFGPAAVKLGNPTFSNLTNVGVSNVVGANCDPNAGSVDPSCVPIEFGSITRFVPALFNDYEVTGRVDLKMTDKDNVFGRYVFQQAISTGIPANGIVQGDWVDVPSRDQQIGLDWARNVSTNFVNQARFSYSRARFGFEAGSFPNCVQGNILNCPTNIGILDGSVLSFGRNTAFPQGRIINVYQVQDNASRQLGKMTIKFGGEYDKQRSPDVFLPTVNGSYTFNTFNDLVANNSFSTAIVLGNPTLRFKENDLAFYFQDDWRFRDNLTLSFGLRWEWFQQAINLLHDQTLAQQTGPHPFWDSSLPLSLTTISKIPQDLNNFSPVIGFSWTPRIMRSVFGEDKTVIRAGFRIGYDPSFYNMFLNVATASPVVLGQTWTQPTVVPGLPDGSSFNGSDILAHLGPLVPTGSNPGFTPETLVANNFHNPYSQQWNLGIQRSFGPRVVAEVRYVGNHTVGNFQTLDGNPALQPLISAGFQDLIPAGLTPCTDLTKPGGAFGNVSCDRGRVLVRANSAFSKYNGLQTQLRMGGWHGVTATASYTFSKTIDNASEVFNSLAGGSTTAYSQNPFDTSHSEAANSGIDFPHTVGVAFIYQVPFYKGQSGFAVHILGGWELNSTYRYSSGQPYTVIQNHTASALCDPAGALSTRRDACRPFVSNASAPLNTAGVCTNPADADCGVVDIATGAPTTLNGVHWVRNDTKSAIFFGSPFLGGPRDSLRGQSISTMNLGVFKDTKLGERVTLQLQVQAFNVLNTQYLGNPDPNISHLVSGTFENLATNANGGQNAVFGNGGSANATNDGIGRRRLLGGVKLIF